MAEKNIVVIGAGVAGLTTALLLSKNPRYTITVAAKHMPGDYDIEYASPWAGADYMPVSIKGTDAAEWDKNTWPQLRDLAQNHPEAGVHFQRAEIYNRTKDRESSTPKFPPDLWWKDLFPDYQEIPKSNLRPGIDNAASFTTVCINTAIYLPWLVSQCLKAGVILKRAIFSHVSEAAAHGIHHSGSTVDVLVNCTGLSALELGGVEDQSLFPVRGQIVVVRNNPGGIFSISGCDDGPDEGAYVMTRAAGGGTVLGGSTQKGNWDSQFDPNLASRIMKRCIDLCPQLTGGKGIEHLDIIRHGVGLRPARHGGARVEKSKVDGTWVVHNYGHGGAGYQSSYGCSQAAVKMVAEVLQDMEE
ncbi:hypothetical protein MMC17_006915 [Xylographa soralifera]|nr:hypothetical protein [Xylographa soralifera]